MKKRWALKWKSKKKKIAKRSMDQRIGKMNNYSIQMMKNYKNQMLKIEIWNSPSILPAHPQPNPSNQPKKKRRRILLFILFH